MEKKLKPTAEKVLAYMINNGSITVREGQIYLHTTEVRSRISELRKAGYDITEKWETYTAEDGTVIRHKRYYLEDAYDAAI